MPPKAAHCGRGGALKRCEYFIKCCNCKQVFAARDFAEHTGGTKTDWRSRMRVFEKHGHPKLKDWIEEQCKAPDAGHPGVGSRICIFWPVERNWYSGQVSDFDDSQGLSKIQYDDGDVEWLHLAVEGYMQPSARVTEVGGGGQLAPHHGEQVIEIYEIYDSDEEAERSAHRQRLAQHSSSAVLINSEPLLIKSEPEPDPPRQHPRAQQSHAVGSRDPSTTHDAHSAHPATPAQPSATSRSEVMIQSSAFAANFATPMLAMQQAHLTGSEAPADQSTKPGQRKRLREEAEIHKHPSHALQHALAAQSTHAADRPASMTAADADAQLVLVSAAHQVVAEGRSHPSWINLVFEPRAKLHACLPANLDSQPGSAQQADCNAPAGLASRAHVPYKAMLMPPSNSAASELDAAVQPGFKLQADSASQPGSTPGQHHQGMLASQKTLQELQAQFLSCGRHMRSDSPALLHTKPHALHPAVPPTPQSLPSMPQAKDWLHHSLLQAPGQQSHLQLHQPTTHLQPLQPPPQSRPSSQPATSSLQHLVSLPKPSSVDMQQQAAIAAGMPTQGSQQSLPAALQLATVPGTQMQTAPSSKLEHLEVLLQKFAWGPNPKGDSPHGILEELVAHLTDAITSARFVAILDRQSTQEAEESLTRYHKRVSALIEKHRAEGYAKVSKVLQAYLMGLCS